MYHPKKQSPKMKIKPFLISKFNAHHMTLTKLETNNKRNKNHLISWPRYANDSFVFQTPEFKLTQYGLMPLGPYASTDAERVMMKLPLDPTQSGCVELETFFRSVDNKLINDNKKIFCMPQLINKKFTYKPIIRHPQESQATGPSLATEAKEKFKFWKAKLNIDWATGDIKTMVFIKDPDAAGLEPLEKIIINTVSDLDPYVRWGCSLRMIVMANKLWADRDVNNNNTREYALSFKILSMEITPRVISVYEAMYTMLVNYAFQDEPIVGHDNDNDNDNDDAKPESPKVLKTKKVAILPASQKKKKAIIKPIV